MRIAIAGGTGTLGAATARALLDRGHEVVLLSRTAPRRAIAGAEHCPVDLAHDDPRLAPALEGSSALVDAINGSPTRSGAAFLVAATRRLVAAAGAAGAGHYVLASIVGVERVPLGYYRAKVEQEEVVEHGSVPWTIVRAAQFHALVAGTFARTARFRLVPAPRGMVLQPMDHREAARAVADAVEAAPRHARVDVAGPEVVAVTDLARQWKAATGARGLVTPLPLMPGLARALRTGGLTNPGAAIPGSPTFAAWLERAG